MKVHFENQWKTCRMFDLLLGITLSKVPRVIYISWLCFRIIIGY